MGVRIGIGAGLGGTPFGGKQGMSDFRRWVDLCEDSAIDSIWQSDRVVSREPALEPLTLLSVIAGATQRLKLGTNAVVLPFRDPINFARQCASLDHLSEGRFLPTVGIGGGASPEWAATGRSPKGRGARSDEALEVITRLWSGESVDFEGEFFQLKDATISPRPAQQPLPLWLGGASKAAIRRTARFGHGWLAPLQSPTESAETVRAIQEECQRIGRPIPDDHYGATILYRIQPGAPPKSNDAEAFGKDTSGGRPELRRMLEQVQVAGPAETILDRIDEYVRGGITKFIAIPMGRSLDDTMEQTRLLAEEVIPAARARSQNAA